MCVRIWRGGSPIRNAVALHLLSERRLLFGDESKIEQDRSDQGMGTHCRPSEEAFVNREDVIRQTQNVLLAIADRMGLAHRVCSSDFKIEVSPDLTEVSVEGITEFAANVAERFLSMHPYDKPGTIRRQGATRS